MAEFERALIQERVKAGIALYRNKTKRWGPGRSIVDMTEVARRRAAGESLRSIARSLSAVPRYW